VIGKKDLQKMFSTNKLHPVYVALDDHQYNRAIKLALALPAENVLGKALLAHAYSKSGQRYQSLKTLQSILQAGKFVELNCDVEYSLQARQEAEATQPQSQQELQQQQQPSSKKGKKGKKNKPVASKQQPTTMTAPTTAIADDKQWDLIDQLNTPPTLPENWEILSPAEQAITDEVSEDEDEVSNVALSIFML
jgi:hypothetical protein